MKLYTGIGSRETPFKTQIYMAYLAYSLAKMNYTLRSGGADGSDTAFENGCDSVGGEKEIYLPWKNFNENKSPLFNVSEEAMKIASKYHPVFNKLTHGAKLLHSRNVYQILGLDLKTPTEFVICWTSDGKASGGSGQAMRIANDYDIPIYNLYSMPFHEKIMDIMKVEIKSFKEFKEKYTQAIRKGEKFIWQK